MSNFWKDWLELRRLWWIQTMYCILLCTSYGLFGYVIACIWILQSPTLLEILLLTAGSFLGTAAIVVSILDCILYYRKSEPVQPLVVEPIPSILPAPTPNPMLVPRKKPLGRSLVHHTLGATAPPIVDVVDSKA
jgi:hypothetical protein